MNGLSEEQLERLRYIGDSRRVEGNRLYEDPATGDVHLFALAYDEERGGETDEYVKTFEGGGPELYRALAQTGDFEELRRFFPNAEEQDARDLGDGIY